MSTAIGLLAKIVENKRTVFKPPHLFARCVVGTALGAGLVVAAGLSMEPVGATGTGRAIAGIVHAHVVAPGDTLRSLSARFGVEPSVIVAANRLASSGALRAGQTLELDARHLIPKTAVPDTVVINVPQRMLFHTEADAVTAIPAAVGRPTWATPTGHYTVARKQVNPTWYVPASILEEARRAGRRLPVEVPPGPSNPLGHFWIGLSGGGIGIHGTNAPASIYRAVTHGCVRLHPDDIGWLFSRLPSDGAVQIIYEPVLLAQQDSRIFLEVHPDVYSRAPTALATVRRLASEAMLSHRVDWTLVESVVAARQGVVRDVTSASGGY